MQIVEQRVTDPHFSLFDLEEFLTRPLFAHLATASEHGPRESPVWFLWDGEAVWIIGGESFPDTLRREPRCALGIVEFDRFTGRVQHVGFRGRAEVLPFRAEIGRAIMRKYLGPAEAEWDRRFEKIWTGETELPLVRIVPDTAVVREQSYHVGPAPAALAQESGGAG